MPASRPDFSPAPKVLLPFRGLLVGLTRPFVCCLVGQAGAIAMIGGNRRISRAETAAGQRRCASCSLGNYLVTRDAIKLLYSRETTLLQSGTYEHQDGTSGIPSHGLDIAR